MKSSLSEHLSKKSYDKAVSFSKRNKFLWIREAYSKPHQTSKMEFFAKTVNGILALTAFVKMSDPVLKAHLDSAGKKRDSVHKRNNGNKTVWI